MQPEQPETPAGIGVEVAVVPGEHGTDVGVRISARRQHAQPGTQVSQLASAFPQPMSAGRVGGQHPLVQVPQARPRLDPEFRDQHVTSTLVGG